MESYSTYYEKFSLDPREWFRSPETQRKLREQEIAMRSEDRKHARENIIKLKNVLKSRGYTIHKDERGSYTTRKTRMLGLSPTDTTKDRGKYTGSLSLPYIRALFTLAHEVGHVLQWNEETDEKYKFQEFFDQVYTLDGKDPNMEYNVLHLQKVWYELDAWVKGMEFIPIELKPQYKKYAYKYYTSYMDRLPRYYRTDIMLRNLLHKLNFEEQ